MHSTAAIKGASLVLLPVIGRFDALSRVQAVVDGLVLLLYDLLAFLVQVLLAPLGALGTLGVIPQWAAGLERASLQVHGRHGFWNKNRPSVNIYLVVIISTCECRALTKERSHRALGAGGHFAAGFFVFLLLFL